MQVWITIFLINLVMFLKTQRLISKIIPVHKKGGKDMIEN